MTPPVVPAPKPERRGVVVECRTCLVRRRVPFGALAISLVPSLWLPTREWPRLMKCPHCGHTAWCRIDWLAREA